MSDEPCATLPSLRAAKLAAEERLRLAERRASAAAKALAAPPGPTEAALAELAAARAAVAAAEDALWAAADALQNGLDDEREAAGEDDDIGPQTDYELREIVAKLHHYHQRATYGAVGDLRNGSAAMVRQWFLGSEAPDNSFVVSASTGEPTSYPAGSLHPMLKRYPEILRTGEALLSWLQRHPVILR